ncbi:MAG: purine-nucleoside phosphorylase [Planctomycetota bacterium]|nr:MAG: purine-nucleoside phosphorylase [Planctomycetota bacterium]
MLEVAAHMAEAAAAVRRQWTAAPRAGIILGSGLGGLADRIDVEAVIDYAAIAHFPRTTAIGHAGKLVCGRLVGKPVIAFQGRFHLYEGHSPSTAGMPVRLLQALGGGALIVSNAAGGLNPQYATGDVMLIDDHINLMFRNPLVGANDDNLGPRFPDMSSPYDRQLQRLAMDVALRTGFVLHRGVYIGVLGPNYETRAEYRLLRRLGGDAVGMSTVPEVIVARHAGLRVLGLSTITNIGSADALTETTGHDVLSVAATAADKLAAIIEGIVDQL